MVEEFEEPGAPFTGARINPRDAVGHLLLVWVIEYLPHKPTQYTRPDKPSDVIVVDVVDLDEVDPDTGESGLLARHTWWRQAKLIQALKPRVGSYAPLLARIAKGSGTQGYNAPFILNSATKEPGAKEKAQEWLTRHPEFIPSTPIETMPEAQGLNPNPQVEAETSPGVAEAPRPVQETLLERMARQAQEGKARLPAPPQSQGPIPF